MDYLQSGVRTLKRHSISNISDAIRNHIHRDSFAGLGRHLFSSSRANDFPLTNADFKSVSAAVVHLFQKKKLQENELSTLQESIRNLMTTEAAPLIYDYYKDKLIRKGMVILRENIKHETGMSLLTKLGEEWNYFYGEILPVLQALLYPVKTKTLTVREVALLEFRNTVLLKLPVKDALQEFSQSDPKSPATQQMLLVLHGVHEYPYTDNSIELEKLVARIISPHLGIMGLYCGGSEPEIKSNFKPTPRLPIPVIQISDDTTESDDEITQVDPRLKRAGLSPQALRLQHKRSSGLLYHPLLAAVREQDRGQMRRYSIATS
ncbi:proline-rich protein 5-like isoform X2 [Mercenaria mercenaria]|uniref:proline-rich protein 5-like isoform X2 n=1 Tax=Mercenaria mercenaria TaxID=6596 RepID=UPI00234ECE6D|nr:proline-rich protein 5-like isoform X2 [Mercenaria mercenaria]